MKVPVKINQKVNGYQYNGTIQIGEQTFDWEIQFGAHLDKILAQEVKPESKEAVRQLFDITLKVGDKKIDISDELFGFLMGTIVALALDFYQEPQTQDFNAGSIQYFVGKLGTGNTATCGMETAYDIPEDRLPK